jgi:AbrB family looped-hinge helix DNA binding protein
MSLATANMSPNGEVVIPYELRKKLNISEKSILVFRESNGELIIRPISPFSELMGIDKKLGISSSSLKKLRSEWNRKQVKRIGASDGLHI